MKIAIHHPAPTFDSYRAALVRSLFNADGIGFDLEADLPIDGPNAEQWQIGLVVGPSGSGKSSIGARIWGPGALRGSESWPKDRPIIDAISPDDGRQLADRHRCSVRRGVGGRALLATTLPCAEYWGAVPGLAGPPGL